MSFTSTRLHRIAIGPRANAELRHCVVIVPHGAPAHGTGVFQLHNVGIFLDGPWWSPPGRRGISGLRGTRLGDLDLKAVRNPALKIDKEAGRNHVTSIPVVGFDRK